MLNCTKAQLKDKYHLDVKAIEKGEFVKTI